MDLALLLPPHGPRGAGLVAALREAILSGRLAPGERLPSSRALAAQLGLARGTVVSAYEQLVSEGYCVARVGAGTTVANLSPSLRPVARGGAGETGGRRPGEGTAVPDGAPSATPRLSAWGRRVQHDGRPAAAVTEGAVRFDFRHRALPELFPSDALAAAVRRAARRLADERGPGDPAGSPRLRRALVATLGRARGLRADPSRVVIVNGSQQGIDLAARLLLDPGDRVCVEEPGYPPAYQVFRALDTRLTPLPVDRSGVVTEALPAAGARMAYVTPSHQYPTGAVLALERRLALLAWAERHDAWLLEDDYDSEFRYVGPPLPCLQGLDRADRCLYLGSLSKLLHPALRIGYLVVPPALVPAVVAAKTALDQATNPIVQEALADLFETGLVERHLRRATRAYRARRAALLAACAAYLPRGVRLWPVTGGLHAYLEAPGIGPRALRAALLRHGVGVRDAAGCHLSPPSGSHLILWFSGIAPHLIEPGIKALAAALHEAAAAGRHTTEAAGKA
jgi:GntR family transcriptional regulator/MocR family aminotransferase